MPVSMAAFHSSLDWIPGHRCSGLMTSAVFALPGMKSVFTWMSAESVDRETFAALLERGSSVCFCPGGVQEVMHLRSPREIVAAGLPEADVRRVVRLLRLAEYKRRQSPVGIRITPRGFGKDWRYPITNRYRDEF